MNIKLTVFFEDAFWVGVFERAYDGKYEVIKVTFGSEPKDYEVYGFLKENFNSLKFSSPVSYSEHVEKHINPKRLQRKINKEVTNTGVGTKAQEALKLQHEASKLDRKQKSKVSNEHAEEEKFELRQQKKKEKHKGH